MCTRLPLALGESTSTFALHLGYFDQPNEAGPRNPRGFPQRQRRSPGFYETGSRLFEEITDPEYYLTRTERSIAAHADAILHELPAARPAGKLTLIELRCRHGDQDGIAFAAVRQQGSVVYQPSTSRDRRPSGPTTSSLIFRRAVRCQVVTGTREALPLNRLPNKDASLYIGSALVTSRWKACARSCNLPRSYSRRYVVAGHRPRTAGQNQRRCGSPTTMLPEPLLPST